MSREGAEDEWRLARLPGEPAERGAGYGNGCVNRCKSWSHGAGARAAEVGDEARESREYRCDPFCSLFGAFETKDDRCPWWNPGDTWLREPEPSPSATLRLPSLPLTPDADVPRKLNRIKNHSKLLAEAIPSLSGPTGGSPLDKVKNVNMHSACRDKDFWPARADMMPPKRGRWLHGDYKNPAYVYVHALYDQCTEIVRQGSGP